MNALQSVSKRFEPLKGGARNAHDYVNGGHVIMLSVQCQHLVSNADEMSNGPSARKNGKTKFRLRPPEHF